MAVAVTTVTQDVYPPRVQVSVTGLTDGDDVVVYRDYAGTRTELRGGSAMDVVDPSFVVIDAELPFGVAYRYVATVNDVEHATSALTITLTGGKVAISDAISGLSAEVVILAWNRSSLASDASVFVVAGHNVVVSGSGLGQRSADIKFVTDNLSSFNNLINLFRNCTEGVFQVRGRDLIHATDDGYFTALTVDEDRATQDITDERRYTTISAVETDAWAPGLEARGFTYADMTNFYAGGTYADVLGDWATYLALLQADWS